MTEILTGVSLDRAIAEAKGIPIYYFSCEIDLEDNFPKKVPFVVFWDNDSSDGECPSPELFTELDDINSDGCWHPHDDPVMALELLCEMLVNRLPMCPIEINETDIEWRRINDYPIRFPHSNTPASICEAVGQAYLAWKKEQK